ncbi:LysM peptidoglycan-binding domain-containing protein [Arcanobacterium hippocoleae]|uniref:LysM repeat protein n=1 Tax=Arcanobacterium hippocoleae TaxID=149017 RepID=A0ABU1T0H2_9ACTO|nr:LysM peptidoglycan-binding domain-containing protein [Arcanobacterium hippocoleae]MDR6938873.1 LysM repeat protein [Arcanobacterium hippocoleae]
MVKQAAKGASAAIATATAFTLFAPATAQAAPNTVGSLALKAAINPATVKQTVTGLSYQVRHGDTLWAIAKRFNTTVSALEAANNINARNYIYAGQHLVIPSQQTPLASTRTAPATVVTASNTPLTHTVKAGDTLSALASRYGVTIAELIKLNGIKNPSLIYVGQVLKLTPGTTSGSNHAPTPAPAATPAKSQLSPSADYTVKAGDTLGAIARKFGTTVNALAQANGIKNPSLIYVGQKIRISGNSNTSTPSPTATTTANTPARKQLVKNNFPGYTYAEKTVAAANDNKYALNAMASIPSKQQVQQMIIATAQKMGVNPRLALAHAYTESGFDATAVSPANAIGVMQVIPSSGKWAGQMVGRQLNLLDPQDNIIAGVAIIRYLQANADSLEQGIAGYYQGLGGVRKYGMKSDTVRYVNKVKAAMQRF